MTLPSCPVHPRSEVVRAGWYGKAGQQRQRWWCRPLTAAAHRFTETLPRIVTKRDADVLCAECTTTLEPWEGQPAPRLYGFSTRHIAEALVAVARGESYRSVAGSIRIAAGRELDMTGRVTSTGKRLPAANVHGQLISDWVHTFGPIIWQVYAPTRWPPVVVLDETEFRVGQPGATRGRLAFVVLAAVGYPATGQPYVAAIEAVPRANVPAWRALLAEYVGRPQRVVTDGGLARRAAERVWPDGDPALQLWRCEWHLARNLTASLPDSVQRDPTDPVHALIQGCQRDPTTWQALNREINKRAKSNGGYLNTTKTLTSLKDLVPHQIATRPVFGPHSSGALEQFFHHLDGTIGDRAARMTNKPRADALLQLLAAHRNGWADETAWAGILRHHLLAHQGRGPQQRTGPAPARPASSLRPAPPQPATVDF